MLLVAALALGVSYGGYASSPVAGAKKTGVLSRLGKGFMVLAFGASLSANVFQLEVNQRMAERYEKLASEMKVLEDDYEALAETTKPKLIVNENDVIGPNHISIREISEEIARNTRAFPLTW